MKYSPQHWNACRRKYGSTEDDKGNYISWYFWIYVLRCFSRISTHTRYSLPLLTFSQRTYLLHRATSISLNIVHSFLWKRINFYVYSSHSKKFSRIYHHLVFGSYWWPCLPILHIWRRKTNTKNQFNLRKIPEDICRIVLRRRRRQTSCRAAFRLPVSRPLFTNACLSSVCVCVSNRENSLPDSELLNTHDMKYVWCVCRRARALTEYSDTTTSIAPHVAAEHIASVKKQ